MLVDLCWAGIASPRGPVTIGEAVRIDVNRAPVAVLALLPGVGPTRAEAIVLHRVRHGRFRRPEDLEAIDGFGAATVAGLSDHVCFCPCGTPAHASVDCAAHGVGSHAHR